MIQALMELALPQFGGLGNRSAPVRKPWMVLTDSPASPDPACTTDLARSPSLCLNLDTLSSDDAEESVIRLLCFVARRTTIPRLVSIRCCRMWTCRLRRIREIGGRSYRLKNCLQSIGSSDRQCLWDARRIAQMGSSSTPLVFRIRPRQSGYGPTSRDLSPVVGSVAMQGVGQAETVHLSAPTMLGQPSPGSPQTITFEVPLSPTCVQVGRSQEMPADGNLLGVSPDTPGFVMRHVGATQQLPGAALPLPLAFDYVSDPGHRLHLLSVLRFRGRMAL